ncbi:hypothetical protein [Marivirga sp.]|uniref:hypothetical protein n=1 Tax=Marivirga sp. TaxID=2018662 RepID=UPI0025D16E38|nr:hypothetical protein [Marivirga sp.]
MKKTLSTLLLILLISAFSYGQETPSSKRNFSYIEVGGAGLFFSVNYERQLSKAPGFSWRVGIGGYSEGDFYVTYNTGFAYLFALNEEESSFIDFGANLTVAREYISISAENRNADIFESVVPGVSYRKHFDNDMILKAGLNAVINGSGLVPWFNIGFGKRF